MWRPGTPELIRHGHELGPPSWLPFVWAAVLTLGSIAIIAGIRRTLYLSISSKVSGYVLGFGVLLLALMKFWPFRDDHLVPFLLGFDSVLVSWGILAAQGHNKLPHGLNPSWTTAMLLATSLAPLIAAWFATNLPRELNQQLEDAALSLGILVPASAVLRVVFGLGLRFGVYPWHQRPGNSRWTEPI